MKTIKNIWYYNTLMNINSPNENLKYFGGRIKHYRLKLGLSQEELAFKCDLTINKISLIELGKVNIRLNTLIKLIKVLPIQLSDILQPLAK